MIRSKMLLQFGLAMVMCTASTNSCHQSEYVVGNDSGPIACVSCPDCPAGQEPKYLCGSTVGVDTSTPCHECPDGTYSHVKGKMPCQPCKQCVENELINGTCNLTSNTAVCAGICKSGFKMNDQGTVCLPFLNQNTSNLKTVPLFKLQSSSSTIAHVDRTESKYKTLPSTAEVTFLNTKLPTRQPSKASTVPLLSSSTIAHFHRRASKKAMLPSTANITLLIKELSTKQSSKASTDSDWRVIFGCTFGTFLILVLCVAMIHIRHKRNLTKKCLGFAAVTKYASCNQETLEDGHHESTDVSVNLELMDQLPPDSLSNPECRRQVTQINELRQDIYCEICHTLDADIIDKDWKALVAKMGKKVKYVNEIESRSRIQNKSPSDILLGSWGEEEGNDVMKLIELLRDVGLTQLASDVETSIRYPAIPTFH